MDSRLKGINILLSTPSSDQKCINVIENTITNTLAENQGSNPHLMWEILKCNIRRDTISFSHGVKKKKFNEVKSLEVKKINLQNLLLQNVSTDLQTELHEVNVQLDGHIADNARGAAMRSRTTYYEEGERWPGEIQKYG